MYRYIIVIFFAFFSTLCLGQRDTTEGSKEKVEVLFNVSDVLGRATGNVNSSTRFTDPIMLGAKLVLSEGNRAIRFGVNFNVVQGDEFANNFERQTSNQFYSFTGGLEFRKKLSKNFEYFYGGDLQYYRDVSKSQVVFFNDFGSSNSEELSAIFNGPGISALIGFRWNIGDRFALYTETNIAFQAINRYRYLKDAQGNKTVLEDNLELTIRPVPPGAIFLTFTL